MAQNINITFFRLLDMALISCCIPYCGVRFSVHDMDTGNTPTIELKDRIERDFY